METELYNVPPGFNYVFGAIWIGAAIYLFIDTFRHACEHRVWASLACLCLFAFGVSDFVEADTGAWWRPWWLLVWKVICLGMLLLIGFVAYRQARASDDDPSVPPEQSPDAAPADDM